MSRAGWILVSSSRKRARFILPAVVVMAVVVTLPLSCAKPEPDVDKLPASHPFKGGTRLRVTYVSIDGLKIRWGLFDEAFGTECAFARWAEGDVLGELRCVPRYKTTSSTFFDDSGCTEGLIDPDPCPPQGTSIEDVARRAANGPTPPPRFVYGTVTQERTVINAAGPLVTKAYVRSTEAGYVSCSLRSALGRPLYRVGAEIPVTTFAAANEEVLDTGGRLAVLAYRSEDGLLFRAGAWDTARREPVGTAEFVPWWVPSRTAKLDLTLFHDEACTQQIATHSKTALPATAVVDERGSVDNMHELGERISGPLYSLTSDGTCAPQPRERIGLGFEPYKVGTKIATTTLDTSRIVEVGTGRLRALYRAGSDGVPIEPATESDPYRDTLRDERCSVLEMLDGSFRCLPGPYASIVQKTSVPELSGGSAWLLALPSGAAPPRTVTSYRAISSCNDSPAAVPYAVGNRLGSLTLDYYLLTELSLDAFVGGTLLRE
jgi:hypothetical protein